MKKYILILGFFIFQLGLDFSYAQTSSVSGVVTDETTNQALPGVNISIKGTSTGTSTNTDGEYTLEIESTQDTLVFSFIGYQAKEISIQGRSTIDVTLNSETILGEELVVTALGIEREAKSLGYSVQKVDGDELAQTNEPNFVTSLTGKVAGANISNSNAMGGSPRITLRGVSSVLGNNQPLYVVDGVPLDNSTEDFQYDDPSSVINSFDVQSVSILKGASASALYGSRAANGVIQITTKDGSGTEGVGVTINSMAKINQVYGLPNYQNRFGGGATSVFQEQEGQLFADYATDESWGPRLDGRMVRQWYSFDDVNGMMGKETPWIPSPDNVKNFYNTGVAFQNNVSISNGGEDYSYRLSLNRLDQVRAIMPESNMQSNGVSFHGSANLSDKLSSSISANYTYRDAYGRFNSGGGAFNRFFQRQVGMGEGSYLADYQTAEGRSRSWNWRGITGAENGVLNFGDSEYWERNKNYEEDDMQRLYGNFMVSYDLADNLNVEGTVRTDYYTTRRGDRTAVGGSGTSSFQEEIREIQETNARLSFTLDQSLNNDFSLDALFAGNVRYNDLSRNINATQGGLSVPGIYTVENSISRPSINDFFQKKLQQSLLGQVTIDYRDMVYLELSSRNDWSSTLPENNNSYLYYSGTGSFVFTELDAFSNSDILSFGKLRASYSKVGNDTDPYRLSTTYPLLQPYGSFPQVSVSNTLSNSGLKPEQTYSWEIGAQVEFFNNRANLDITYYNSRTEDQITPVKVSRTSGYESQIINAGEISNKGLEATFGVTPIQASNGLRWQITGNWTKNVNKLVSLAPGLQNIEFATTYYGPSVNARVGEPYGALIGTNFTFDENGNKIVNPDGTYAVDSNPQVLGSYMPDWKAGLSTSLNYKGFSGSISFDGQKGGEIFSGTNEFGKYSGMLDVTVRDDIRELGLIAEGVQADGSENTVVTDPASYFKKTLNLNAASIYDASYIKLRQVRLAYSVPVSVLGNTPIQGLVVSVTGRNLATMFKNVPNIDPVNVTSPGNVQGIEISDQIPPQRVYNFSVEIKL